MSSDTYITRRASIFRAGKENPYSFDTSESVRAVGIYSTGTATYRRIDVAATRGPGSDYTEAKTR